MQKCFLAFAAFLLLANASSAQTGDSLQLSVTTSNTPSFILTDPNEVLKHEGEFITVEGCVVSAILKEDLNGKPLFLNMFAPHPQNLFTVVIWGQDQAAFQGAADYDKKLVRITGMAEKRKNQARITISLRNPKQITVLGDCQ